MHISLKEIAAVLVAVAVNALVISQIVGGITLYRPNVAFAQPYNDGEPCTDPADCDSGNCEQDVCCNRPCNGTTETCDQPGVEGTCTSVLPAPAMSWPGQIMAALLVTLLGWYGLRRLRED